VAKGNLMGMNQRTSSRRRMIGCSLGAAAVAMNRLSLGALGFSLEENEGEAIPFLDAASITAKGASLNWNELRDWVTATPQVYYVSHYGTPQLKAEEHQLHIGGLVSKPMTLTMEQIKAMPKKEVTVTLECGGNGASAGFCGAIANAKWAGTPLAPVLKQCGILEEAVEVAFWGADKGTEKIRGNDVTQHFGRSLSIKNALRDDILLCYEMNGEPLNQGHGFPLRLVVPGWFGVAWVKWLDFIEVRDRALMTRFMAKDYVTLRGEQRGDKVIWKETSVGPMNIKSMVGRATRRADGTVMLYGAAWSDGTPIKSVQIKVDGADWAEATIVENKTPYTWTFWSYAWQSAAAGEHTVVSRAIDAKGRSQPSSEDPAIKLKKTYWEANQQWPRKIKI
jgi:DMSO/TMAO reductase YedYZ molybdopterin-dependent catalytic subunit